MNKKEFKNYEYYTTCDLPIPYKDKLSIYPTKLKDFHKFNFAIACLTLDKNKVSDIEVLSMSYLEYLVSLINKKGTSEDDEVAMFLEGSLYEALRLFLNAIQVKVKFDSKGKMMLSIIVDDGWIDISRREFEEIKDIILFQNIIDYDNEYIDPDVEQEIATMNELQSKRIEMPSIELKKVTLSMLSGYKLNEIDELTIRKFNLMLEQSDGIENYRILKQAELGGMVTFSEKVSHYLYKNKKSKTDGALISYDGFRDKMSKVAK